MPLKKRVARVRFLMLYTYYTYISYVILCMDNYETFFLGRCRNIFFEVFLLGRLLVLRHDVEIPLQFIQLKS